MNVNRTLFFTSLAQVELAGYFLSDYAGKPVYSNLSPVKSSVPQYLSGEATMDLDNIHSGSYEHNFLLVFYPTALRIANIRDSSTPLPIVSTQTTSSGQPLNGYILQAGAYTVIGALSSTNAEIANRFGQGNPMTFLISKEREVRVPVP